MKTIISIILFSMVFLYACGESSKPQNTPPQTNNNKEFNIPKDSLTVMQIYGKWSVNGKKTANHNSYFKKMRSRRQKKQFIQMLNVWVYAFSPKQIMIQGSGRLSFHKWKVLNISGKTIHIERQRMNGTWVKEKILIKSKKELIYIKNNKYPTYLKPYKFPTN